jgi:hypothetical protein
MIAEHGSASRWSGAGYLQEAYMATRILRPSILDLTGLSRSSIHLQISRGTFPRQVLLGQGQLDGGRAPLRLGSTICLSSLHLLRSCPSHTKLQRGRVAEWLMAPVLKTGVPERVSGVRIPPLPPFRLLIRSLYLEELETWLKWAETPLLQRTPVCREARRQRIV